MIFRMGVCGLVLALTGMAAPAAAAAGIELAPHRAAYKLTLKAAKQQSGIVDASGALYFELTESCEGWEVKQLLRLTILDKNNRQIDSRTSFTSWESKDGLNYRFDSRTRRNGKLAEKFRGSAKISRDGGAGEVVFTLPKARRMKLPAGTMFPTAHTRLLLQRAAAGETMVWRIMFDGADDDGPYGISAVVGDGAPPEKGSKLPAVANRRSWRFKLAFFPYKSPAAAPDYELTVRLNDNSVARDMVLDYGKFRLDATPTLIEPLKRPDC